MVEYKRNTVSLLSLEELLRIAGKHSKRRLKRFRKLAGRCVKKGLSDQEFDELKSLGYDLLDELGRVRLLDEQGLYREIQTVGDLVEFLARTQIFSVIQQTKESYHDMDAVAGKFRELHLYINEVLAKERSDQHRLSRGKPPRMGFVKRLFHKPKKIAKDEVRKAVSLGHVMHQQKDDITKLQHAVAYIQEKTTAGKSISDHEFHEFAHLVVAVLDDIRLEVADLAVVQLDAQIIQSDLRKLLMKLGHSDRRLAQEAANELLGVLEKSEDEKRTVMNKFQRKESLADLSRRDFLKKFGVAVAGVALAPTVAANAVNSGAVQAASQPNPKNATLCVRKVYGPEYQSLGTDDAIAKELFPLSLQEAFDKGYIARDMGDLLLPLGVIGKSSKVDFVQGMQDMWNHKKGTSWSSGESWQINQGALLRSRRDHFVKRVQSPSLSSLRKYRDGEITEALSVLASVHKKKREGYSELGRAFMDLVVENLSPNVLIGYNIQELIPPWYKGQQINPVFKTYFLDHLFKEAGNEFVEGYPARYDYFMSYGPFQLSKYAVEDIQEYNKYLSSKLPAKMQDFSSLQQHVTGAALFAYINWARLASDLKNAGVLDKFVNGFATLDKTKRQIFMAGVTACMHHLPADTRKYTTYYVSDGDLNNLHFGVRRFSFSANVQLQKYYDNAAEAYLFMKVFHVLDERYANK